MIKNKKMMVAATVAAIAVVALILRLNRAPSRESERDVKPVVGSIRTSITATATVQPQNRLEVKAPINGRIDVILVKEGDRVTEGQPLARMSSTERAALLDVARARGPDEVRRWEDVYKPTLLISPIDGEVIVSTMDPGQTITSADAVVVLSDQLIVQAQVDETDIGGIAVGQEAEISLDAYPRITVKGKVSHIYYESRTVNNVTVYYVDIVPESVPAVFRSGMSATVTILEKSKQNACLIPNEAVRRTPKGDFVLVRPCGRGKPEERPVQLGLSDEKNVEVLSGVSPQDIVVVKSRKYTPEAAPKRNSNPFMPSRRGR